MKINDDNFEFVFASTPPPGQPSSCGPNLPQEGSTQPLKRKIKPLDLNNPVDYQIALDAVLKEIEDQEHASENTRKQADKELGRPSCPITEQDVLNCIKRGKEKDTPERLAAIEREKNDTNSPERGEFYKKILG